MAVGVFAVGVTGVFSLQSVTASTNRQAKDLAVATRIAESWQEQLAIDALSWVQPIPPTSSTPFNVNAFNQTTWLRDVLTTNGWHVPATTGQNYGAGTGSFGPSFTVLGDYTATAANAVFCTNLRLTPLLATNGSGLMRAEVRVYWPRYDRTGWEEGVSHSYNYCQDSALGDVTNSDFHFVYKTSVIRQTVGL
jgi:hypothetical protein